MTPSPTTRPARRTPTATASTTQAMGARLGGHVNQPRDRMPGHGRRRRGRCSARCDGIGEVRIDQGADPFPNDPHNRPIRTATATATTPQAPKATPVQAWQGIRPSTDSAVLIQTVTAPRTKEMNSRTTPPASVTPTTTATAISRRVSNPTLVRAQQEPPPSTASVVRTATATAKATQRPLAKRWSRVVRCRR